MKIVGSLTLTQKIYCQCEVLGKIMDTNTSGIDVSVSFPKFNAGFHAANKLCYKEIRNPLLPPDVAKKWRRGNEMLDWGYPCSYSCKHASISLLAITTECEDTKTDETAQILYESIDKWENAFIEYCILSARQRVLTEAITRVKSNKLELMDKNGYINTTICLKMHLEPKDPQLCLSESQVRDALDFASSGKELYFEYQMLFSAYEARDSERNRQTIVDACSALERCCVTVDDWRG